jgi:hypothetical protein
MDASLPAASPRRWWSLLAGRWHWSSRVVMGLLLGMLVFCNVPGQSVAVIRYDVGSPFDVARQREHGWPLTYLIRVDWMRNAGALSPPEGTVRNCFELWRDCTEFRLWSLLANACVVLLAALAGGLAFEAWRRQRSRLWHLHLTDLFATTFAVALVAAWYAYGQRQYAMERAILSSLEADGGNLSVQCDQEGGITWLRLCFGDQYFEFLDHPFSVYVEGHSDWLQLEKLTTVRDVETSFGATTEELAHLSKMPHLETLSLGYIFESPEDDRVGIAELPPLPHLRGLYLWHPAQRWRRLDRLTSLEALRIGEQCIDEEALREISSLPNLRELALNGLSESADLSFLPSRPRLSGLDFYHSEVSAPMLKCIGQCPHLKELSLYMCRVDGSGIRHLSGLANLESLNLQYTDVTSADLAPLAKLKRLREFELTKTKIRGDFHFMSSLECLETLRLYDTKVTGEDLESLVGLPHLRSLDLGYTDVGAKGRTYLTQMKQLKWLRISNLDQVELQALRASLPECEVMRH